MNNPEQAEHRSGDHSASEPNLGWTGLGSLSPRQRAIARLIACGHSDREIGTDLNLDCAAVAEEVEQVRRVLGSETRVQIAVLVRQHDPIGGDREGRLGRRGRRG